MQQTLIILLKVQLRMNLDTFFGYVDNPNTSKSSIMKYSRNRNGMPAPQTFDVDNVNAKYD